MQAKMRRGCRRERPLGNAVVRAHRKQRGPQKSCAYVFLTRSVFTFYKEAVGGWDMDVNGVCGERVIGHVRRKKSINLVDLPR